MARTQAIDSQEHKEAFELYTKLKSYRGVARELSVDKHTIKRWATGDIMCHCPYHNWDRLIAEREKVEEIRRQCAENGITDPLEVEQAILDSEPCQISVPEIPEIKEVVSGRGTPSQWKATLRSDLERLSHLELLYAKVFFHLTGVVLDHSILMSICSGELDDDALEREIKKYLNDPGNGLQPTNMEQCMNVMFKIIAQIDVFKERLGLHKKSSAPSTPPEEETASSGVDMPAIEEKQDTTIEALRKVRKKLLSMSPEEREAHRLELESEGRVTVEQPRGAAQ